MKTNTQEAASDQQAGQAAMLTASPAPAPMKRLKVMAIKAGYIGDGPIGMIYRNVGDVFTLTPREIPLYNAKGKGELDETTGKLKTRILSVADQFSANWMEVVDEAQPERITTAQTEINRQISELNARGPRAADVEAA